MRREDIRGILTGSVMKNIEKLGKPSILYPTSWQSSRESDRYSATVPNDERQHCDSLPAKPEENLSEEGMLFAFVHSTVMQVGV